MARAPRPCDRTVESGYGFVGSKRLRDKNVTGALMSRHFSLMKQGKQKRQRGQKRQKGSAVFAFFALFAFFASLCLPMIRISLGEKTPYEFFWEKLQSK
jgi:hypothetical protein